MKKIAVRFACAALLCVALLPVPQSKACAQETVVSYQTFYDQLAPYGQWVADPQYGNVWVPNEEPGYRPYATRGNWVMTDQGNMWVSDVPWGWACYHYGRWTYNSFYGWVWIPGTEWAPAWVNWRSGGGYYGWAPMGPGQYPGSYYEYPVNYWVFVSPQYLYRPAVYGYYQPAYNETYYRQTTYINETYAVNGSSRTYYYGPRADVIERESGQPVLVYHVTNSNAPGAASVGSSAVSIYRPAVSSASVNTARPANVVRAEQPIGKPQAVASTTAQPAFHEQMQRQNPAFAKPNTYMPSSTTERNMNHQPANNNNMNREQGHSPNNVFNHQTPESLPQNGNHQNEQMNRSQPQNNENSQPQNEQLNRQPQNNTQNNHGQPANRQQKQQRTAQPKEQKH